MSETVTKVQLTISGVLADLNSGLDRVAIREKYGLSATDVARVFEHPKLKGVRVRKAPAFELVDDVPDTETVVKRRKAASSKASIQSDAPLRTAEKATEQPKQEAAKAEEEEEALATTTGEEPTGEIKEVVVPGEEAMEEEAPTTKKGLW